MNKSEFLKRLAALLHILQEDEVKDILDEYEQHIDMKMEGGMSEHDAIRDFGSVEELARKPYLHRWVEQQVFQRYIGITRDLNGKRSIQVFDAGLELLC